MAASDDDILTVFIGRWQSAIGAQVLKRFKNGRLYVRLADGRRRNIGPLQVRD